MKGKQNYPGFIRVAQLPLNSKWTHKQKGPRRKLFFSVAPVSLGLASYAWGGDGKYLRCILERLCEQLPDRLVAGRQCQSIQGRVQRWWRGQFWQAHEIVRRSSLPPHVHFEFTDGIYTADIRGPLVNPQGGSVCAVL